MKRLTTAVIIWLASLGAAFAQPATTTVPSNLLTQPFTSKITTLTPTTATAGFNLPQGTAPTSPVNGDLWMTSSGLFFRVAGVTAGPIGNSGLITNGTPVTGASAGQVLYSDGTKLQAYTAVPLSVLGATSAATTIGGNSIVGNWSNLAGSAAVQTMPSCADTGGAHLNYVGNVGITCGSTGGVGTAKGVLQANGSGVVSAAYVSVVAYGADPSGAADSSTAFTSAIAASNYVFIPCGTYKLNITISANHGTLLGSQCANLTANSSSTAIISYTGSGDYFLKDLYITGMGNTAPAISVNGSDGNVIVEDNVIAGFTYGVYCSASSGSPGSGMVVRGSTLLYATVAEVYFSFCNDALIQSNSIGGSGASSSGQIGIEFVDSRAGMIANNFVYDNKAGIVLGGAITGSGGTFVQNNRITQSYYQGAQCAPSSPGLGNFIQWQDNQFYTNSAAGSGSYPHLELLSGCSDNVITGNNFFNAILSGNNTNYSVIVDSGASANYIGGNNMTNNATGGISDSGSSWCGSQACSAGNGTNYVH